MGFRFDDDSRSAAAPHSVTRDPASFVAQRSLKRDLLGQQREGWVDGNPERPEALLGRWPADPESDPDAASLLLEDYLQRRRRGEESSLEDYVRSFPAQSAAFRRLVAAETVCRSLGRESQGAPLPLRLPGTGDEVFGFRLGRPLGEGAFARVFLAEQRDLAGRPVVLKVTDVEGSEPQTLAQLLHANIVPIYSLHEDRRAGLRAVCMPYLGGASLSSVLAWLWADTNRPITGEQFVQALQAVEAPRPAALTPLGSPTENSSPDSGIATRPDNNNDGCAALPLANLRSLSFERAAAWTVAQLAEGLHHAHERGILHRDIKPSNILIAADGQPLLLDFNLARSGNEDPAHATIGGTVAYMSPEHLRALVGRTSALIRQVDRRSDIYSLGMVLAEMLTGHRPFDQSGSYSAIPLQIEAMALERSKTVPSVRRTRPDISWGMESIVRKCLAAEPTERYQRADHLADDLRRLLEDRPLRHAPELSRVEAARKFARRHPRIASAGTVIGASALVLFTIGAALAAARSRLAAVEIRELVRAHDAGVTRALCLINTQADLRDHLREGIAACEQTLALLGDPGSPDGARERKWDRLAPEDHRRLAEDRRELLLLLADARFRLEGGSRQAAVSALHLLEQAGSIPGLPESRALWLDRARYLAVAGDSAQADRCRRHAESIHAATARDHYLIAAAMARQGGPNRLRAAIAELDEALRLNPRHYWSLVQRGICRLDRGELAEAAGDFGQCTGIWPEFAWGYFNLGCALDRSGGKSAAILDYSAAIERDPSLAPAYVNRGLARLELQRDAEALADFERALELGVRNASISAGRGVALERLGRHAEADAAFNDALTRSARLDGPARARLARSYGFAIAMRDPARAGAAFDEALRHDPRDAKARYGLGMLAMTRGDNRQALREFDRALAIDPDQLDSHRYRAILLARRGEWQLATREVNQCLEREPRSPASLYAAACVVALAHAADHSAATARQALDLLDRAVAEGADLTRAADDPDLASIRLHPRFTRLVGRSGDRRIGASRDSSPPIH